MEFIRDNIFIIVLLVGGAISQWMKSRSEKQAEEHQPEDYFPEEAQEEATRKHHEASRPPSLPKRAVSTAYALSHELSAELARQAELNEKILTLKHSSKRHQKAVTKSEKESPSALNLKTNHSIRQTLHQKSELRKAIILREILDKPLSLR